MRILVAFGTRPEIVKLAPVVHALDEAGHEVCTAATGQHDDPMLADAFLADLAVTPTIRHALPDGDDGVRVGALLEHAYGDLRATAPDVTMILGDTNTVPAYALASRRHGVPVVHLEAGLRSFNERSLEEVNRRVGAATAALHLAPTELAGAFLRAEGVPSDRIEIVGNPITDVLRRLAPPPRPSEGRTGVLVTAHRATNVDDRTRLAALVRIVERLAVEGGSVRFPLHPRTRARLEEAGLLARLAAVPGVHLEDPLRYAEMLEAITAAKVVVTDSGGLQEEAAWFGIPVVVLRTTTPRWEGVVAGTTRLTGLDVDLATQAARELATPEAQARIAGLPCPYGDGHVAARVVEVLTRARAGGRLRVDEPVLGEGLPAAVVAAVDAVAESTGEGPRA